MNCTIFNIYILPPKLAFGNMSLKRKFGDGDSLAQVRPRPHFQINLVIIPKTIPKIFPKDAKRPLYI